MRPLSYDSLIRPSVKSKIRVKSGQVLKDAITGDGRTFTAVFSTEEVDRDGDLIEVGGIDTRAYMRNPIVLGMHDFFTPIGKTARLWTRTLNGVPALMGRVELTGAQAADFAHDIAQGILNSMSIGFIPIRETRRPDVPNRVYTAVELIEVSVVSVPSNRSALIER